jgi:adenylate cyclase
MPITGRGSGRIRQALFIMAYLEIIEGPSKGSKIPVVDGMTIGRHTGNALVLADTSISRQHARIHFKNGYFAVVDLGSANGTIVNKNPLHKLVPQPLYDRDEIVVGSSRIIFNAEGIEPPVSKKTNIRNRESLKIAPPGRPVSSLSVVMTSEDMGRISVNATIDASRGIDEHILDKQNSPKMLLDVIKRLQAMVALTNDCGTVTRPETLVNRIMESIFDIFPFADRAFVMLRKHGCEELVPFAARRRDTDGGGVEEFAVSRTIIKTVTEKKQSVLSSDAQKDERFAAKSVVDLSIRSMMCAPLVCKDELLGIIGVDTITSRQSFTADDLGMLTGIASQAAVAIKNAELYSAIEKETQVRTQLSRYLSPDVVEGVIDGTIPLRLGGEKKYGTLLFCDIVGFTSMAESLSATETVDKLNRYYAVVTEIITGLSGTLHKFGGDMVMAFWNVMYTDNLAEEHAIRAGLEMQNAVWLFDLDLEREGQLPIHLGIGCNTGEFAGGNIGGLERMEYTVIGDNVNLAQRIESLACRWQVLVSSETIAPVKDKCVAIGLPPVAVKGKKQSIKILSVRGFKLDDRTLLLGIPVSLFASDGSKAGEGLLTKKDDTTGTTELHLLSPAPVPSHKELTLEFDLPELSSTYRISGLVIGVSGETYNGKTGYAEIVLGNLKGEPEALRFLEPGKEIESKKNWPEMKRH